MKLAIKLAVHVGLYMWLECITHNAHVWWRHSQSENRYLYILYLVSDCTEGKLWLCVWAYGGTDSSCSPTGLNIHFIGQRVKRELRSKQNVSLMKHASNLAVCHVSENVNFCFLLPINRGHYVPILTKMKHKQSKTHTSRKVASLITAQ
jgi:hypothetical protein